MKLFLDSAQVDEIAHALKAWDVDGVTTNPRHIQASGKPFPESSRRSPGLSRGPTSRSASRSTPT